jgi:hypothetical protein
MYVSNKQIDKVASSVSRHITIRLGWDVVV